MSVIQRVKKPSTHKGKKILVKREPQVKEGPKSALFFQGRNSSENIRGVMKDLFVLKKPDATSLTRKNDITIFENITPVEQFCRKHETPLFVMGSHSKKRPDNLVIGRTYDYALLDMLELHVSDFLPMSHFDTAKVSLGCKPSLIFQGNWDSNPRLQQLKSILIDLFHREKVDSIRLQGLEHTISFTATEPDGKGDGEGEEIIEGEKVLMRSYKVLLKKSGGRVPRIELEEMGPRVDFSLRRAKLPTEDLMRQALRQPTKENKTTKKKNISTDGLGTTHGRIHIGKQDVGRLQTRKMKGLRKTAEERRQQKMALKRKLDDSSSTDVEQSKAVKAVKAIKKVKRVSIVT